MNVKLYLVGQLLVDGCLRGVGSFRDVDVNLEPGTNSINLSILVNLLKTYITLNVRAECVFLGN